MTVALQDLKQKEREQMLKMKELRREIEGKITVNFPVEASHNGCEPRVEQYQEIQEVDRQTLKRIVEALLFVAHKPLTVSEIKKVVAGVNATEIKSVIQELKEEFQSRGSSFRLQEIAGGYEISTSPEFAPWIMKLELEKRKRQATQSALETLAILAYKQPVTRVEIEELRGVNVSAVLSTLLERNLIKIVGRKEVPGRPLLYGTTEKFLEHFGLKSLEELPKISEIKELVDRMVNREELLGREGVVVPIPEGDEKSEDRVAEEETIPSQEERKQVLEEVSTIIKSTNTKLNLPEAQNGTV